MSLGNKTICKAKFKDLLHTKWVLKLNWIKSLFCLMLQLNQCVLGFSRILKKKIVLGRELTPHSEQFEHEIMEYHNYFNFWELFSPNYFYSKKK